ncbi:CxxH/CxxC protein [Bacillaceae bacterium IKA-2]|nr:CxxH/CxxC protein [Bacillaceae bacterium IKA-2]
MYYCCEEHVELAIDMIVDEEEKAPIMEKLNAGKELSTLCTFCTETAIYKLSA